MFKLQLILISFLYYLLFLETLISAQNQSPPCEGTYQCLSFITIDDCQPGQFLEIDKSQSCCPRCRGGIGFKYDGCNARRICAPGLKCVDGVCELNRDLCTYTYHLRHLNVLPTCELDGTFSAKQCKGDKVSGRCFCYNEKGERTFGWDWWKQADNMTCACSRYRSILESNGRLDVTLHCSQNGNYEELQCDSGICWCAEPQTGRIQKGTRAVPDTMWTLLPCYNKEEYGNLYLRQCESSRYGQNVVRKALYNRGTMDISFSNIQCDYDGSFGKYTIVNGIAACTWRDGTRIGSYQVNSNAVAIMDCNCARDQKIFEEAGLTLTLSCAGNGNYESVQDMNGKIFCLDTDGFSVTDYFDTIDGLDCNQYLYTHVSDLPE